MADYILETIENCALKIETSNIEGQLYECSLVSSTHTMTRQIEMKPDSTSGPTAGQMLYYYAVRAQSVEICDDFLDWAAENDLDASESAVLNDYRTLVSDADDLKALLGTTSYDNLLSALAIDQAIRAARPR